MNEPPEAKSHIPWGKIGAWLATFVTLWVILDRANKLIVAAELQSVNAQEIKELVKRTTALEIAVATLTHRVEQVEKTHKGP